MQQYIAERIAAEITARTEWAMGKAPRAWQGNLLVRLMTMGLDQAIYESSTHRLYALGTDWRHNAHQLAMQILNEPAPHDT